jgi:uncharacterized protein (TIGR00290 family)
LPNPTKTLLSWSSGKDSAWTLQTLQQDPGFEVVGLLTTLNQKAERVAMHAVRARLLDLQAEAAGLPLIKIGLPYPCTNADYERIMGEAMADAKAEGVEAMAFGDLFLEDIRAYREDKLQGTGIDPVFPLWGRDTSELAREMIAGGLGARLTCVDPRQLDPGFAGREFDAALLEAFPDGVDPCGERGEFHSFVYEAPCFRAPIPVVTGEVVEREGFVYADLLPG